jgi:hypothetical protein
MAFWLRLEAGFCGVAKVFYRVVKGVYAVVKDLYGVVEGFYNCVTPSHKGVVSRFVAAVGDHIGNEVVKILPGNQGVGASAVLRARERESERASNLPARLPHCQARKSWNGK